MSNHHAGKQTNRVFGRLGARELTPEEIANLHAISSEGKNFFTLATFNPIKLQLDGDPAKIDGDLIG